MILLDEKKQCCGCGACMNICPKGAITMDKDVYGFYYPTINNSLCINCGACTRVCAFQNADSKETEKTGYGVTAKDDSLTEKSSSGGVFAVVAKHILKQGGIVYGAAYADTDLFVHHIRIESVSDLARLQGSKYVRSEIQDIFTDVRNQLKTGRPVLFSGTPCQVGAIKAFLGKEPENLYTMDIVCHGTPSGDMFKNYIRLKEQKYGKQVTGFVFRNKENGWSTSTGKITFIDGTEKKIYSSEESYPRYFLAGSLYRDSCYNCRYASADRPGDITAGDFWGVEKANSSFDAEHHHKGISALICNTEKGKELFEECKDDFYFFDSSFEEIARGNDQLNHPSKHTHPKTMEIYAEYNWEGVERLFKKEYGIKRYSGRIKSMIPESIKRMIKKKR